MATVDATRCVRFTMEGDAVRREPLRFVELRRALLLRPVVPLRLELLRLLAALPLARDDDPRPAVLRFAVLRLAVLRFALLRFAVLRLVELRLAELRPPELRLAELRPPELLLPDRLLAERLPPELRPPELRPVLVPPVLRLAELRFAVRLDPPCAADLLRDDFFAAMDMCSCREEGWFP